MLRQTYETIRNLVMSFEYKWIPAVAFFIIGAGTSFKTFIIMALLVMVLSASGPVKRVNWEDAKSDDVILARAVLVGIAVIKLIVCMLPTWVWGTMFVILLIAAVIMVLKR